jgi:serine/threonine protein kinase
LSYDYVKNVLLKIGNALIKIHQKQIYHFNVKPSNIILNNDEPYLNPLSRVQKIIRANIISKLSDPSNFSDATVYKEELCYLPPEKFDGMPSTDPPSKSCEKIDQYMLGLLGYELLTAAIPPTLTDIHDLRENGISAFKPLDILTNTRKDCPHKFARIIHKMTDYDPNNRYDSLEEAIKEMQEVSFDHFEIAKDSYARCISGSDAGNSFFKTFYHELLRTSPEAAIKFKGKGVGESDENRQYGILREAIFILLMFGENRLGDNEPNILSRIAEMHNKNNYDVTPESYKAFVSALTATICGLSPDVPQPFDPQCKISANERNLIRNAWQKALKPGIDYMIMKYSG